MTAAGAVARGALGFAALAAGLVPRLPVPRAAGAGFLVPPLAWTVLLVAGVPEGPLPLPMLAATVLDAATALGLSVVRRRTAYVESRHPVAGLSVAAVLVAAVALPAIWATGAVDHRAPGPPPSHAPTGH